MTLISKDDKPWYNWDLMPWCAAWSIVHRLPGVCWILISDLKVLISTLPVKGEESLDLQPSDTAGDPSGCPVSQNLDNHIIRCDGEVQSTAADRRTWRCLTSWPAGMLHCVTVTPSAAAPHAAYKYAQGE